MTDFPNISNEQDFIRAYKFQLALLLSDIRSYVATHGFDEEMYNKVYGQRIGDIYMCISNPPWSDLISNEVMEALAMLYHIEVRQQSKDFGFDIEDLDDVKKEYSKRAHLLDV